MRQKLNRISWKCGAIFLMLTGQVLGAETMLTCDFQQQKNALKSPGPAMVAEIPEAMTPIPLNAVQFGDKNISKKIMVEGLYARRTEADTLEVMARLVNCTDYPQHLQLRSSFMDSAQMPVENTSAWSRVFIPAKSTGVYSEKSISTHQVHYYLIELREGD